MSFVIATKGKKNTNTAKIVIVFLNVMKAKNIVVGAKSAEQRRTQHDTATRRILLHRLRRH